jgi:hypothetical protein
LPIWSIELIFNIIRSEDDSEALMDLNDWNIMKLREIRYDCVIHLVTAAIGAEKCTRNHLFISFSLHN